MTQSTDDRHGEPATDPGHSTASSRETSPNTTPEARTAPPTIVVQGDSYSRGRQYGESASARIERSIRSYQAMFATCDISWQAAIERALPCTDAAFTLFPQLEAELRGLADGSGVSFESLAALNCRTEILPPDYLARATGLSNSELPDSGHLCECTSFAFSTPNSSVWLAQNWDWLGMQRESLVLLESAGESDAEQHPDYLTVTEAGMLAKIGLNSHGLGITLNILRSRDDGASPGMPIHLFLRGILDCKSVEEVLELTRSISFAGSSNVMIADSHGNIASIEAAPSGAKVLFPSATTESDSTARLCHTNHFLHPELVGCDAGLTGNISTDSRLHTAQENLQSLDNLDDINRLLSDTSNGLQSICRFPDPELPLSAQVETVVGVAMDLTNKELWLSAAQPSITPLQPHRLAQTTH